MKKLIKKVKKTLRCDKCGFSTVNAGALAVHKLRKHPAERPFWHSYKEFVDQDWGKKFLKKELNEFPGFDVLHYGMLLRILEELILIRQELRKTKTII